LTVDSDAERAIVQVAIGSPEEKRLATSWLRGDKLAARDMRSLGFTRSIQSASDAIQVLNDLITVIYLYHSPVILLLDEMQELEDLGRRLPECIGGLHKIFDLNPHGLTLVFSFTTGSRTTVRSILGEALFDRASEMIALPPLTSQEAIDFISTLIMTWSLDQRRTPAPFTLDTIRAVVSHLDSNGIGLTPRALMKAFDQVLRDGEYDIASGESSIIGPEYALRILEVSSEDEFQ
jgi:hypothetical protein